MDSPCYSCQQQNNCIKFIEFSLFQHLAYSPLHLLFFIILTILGEVLVLIPALQMRKLKLKELSTLAFVNIFFVSGEVDHDFI